MARGKQEEEQSFVVTDLEAIKENTSDAVRAFAERWMPAPRFDVGVEVMDLPQLRDAMGIRATFDSGDPWPAAERELLEIGFRWSWNGGQRVMFVMERSGYVPDTGWTDAEETEEE